MKLLYQTQSQNATKTFTKLLKDNGLGEIEKQPVLLRHT